MSKFKVVLEIELDANSPLDAAKKFESWIRESHMTYVVQDEQDNIYTVDLSEDDEDATLESDGYEPLIS